MKRGFFGLISLLAFVLGGCSYESADTPAGPKSGSLTLRLEIEDIDTGVASSTRNSIPSESGETTIASLHLLFYNYRSDGSGTFAKTYSPGSATMNADYTVTYDGTELVEGNDYVILAVANIADYLGSSETETGFLERMADLTEKQALEQVKMIVQGVGTNETGTYFGQQKIDPAELPMSVRVEIRNTEQKATVRLTRGVVRFDIVDNNTTTGYELVSASVWGAASESLLWAGSNSDTPARLQRYYGLLANEFIYKSGGEFKGGLYAFENYVSSPQATDEATTCVVVGLRNQSTSTLTYYRVNVNLPGSPQNLVRNHVYKISINSVSGDGAETEYNAWKQANTQLSVSINEWNLDDGGMVLTDGTNTMVLPVKVVRLDADGDSRAYTVFTQGVHTLAMTRNSFTESGIAGINVKLTGNLLTVTADPLPVNMDERRGSIELTYGTLRGTITFIQSPMENLFLTLDRYDIPNFLSLGRTGISDNAPLAVTASGAWTAKIYNTSENAYNPGFSFYPSSDPVVELKSSTNPYGNLFQIYTTGDNPNDNEERHGFMIITLDEDPENFQRVVVMSQSANIGIGLTPELTSVRFSAMGVPTGIANPSKETGFEFTVDAGKQNGVPNRWTATVQTGSEYFEVDNTNASLNKFSVKAKGSNLTNAIYTGTVLVKIDGSDVSQVISITQDMIGLSITTQGTTVAKTGGHIEGVSVNIDGTLTWEATITSNHATHPGYLMTIDKDGNVNKVAGNTVTGLPNTTKLSVGFDKIYYPLVNVSPEVKVTISVSGSSGDGGSTELIVKQDALTPIPMNILDVRNTSYGCLIGGANYLEYYRTYLRNATMFGTGSNSYVKTATAVNITGIASGSAHDPVEISENYAYLHAGGQPANDWTQARHNAVNNWWKKYEGERIVVYAADNRNGNLFVGGTRTSVMSILGYTYHATDGTPRMNSSVSSEKVFEYLVKDGPFRKGTQYLDYNAFSFTRNSTSSGTNPASLPAGAVPVITDSNGSALLVIDPKNNVVFFGESQMFDSGYSTAAVTAAGNGTDKSKFLGNLLAYIVNAAQYGSHFTDLFLDQNLYDQQKSGFPYK